MAKLNTTPKYPEAASFAARLDDPFYGAFDELHEEFERRGWSWGDIQLFKYSYGVYFNDLVEAVNELGHDFVFDNYDDDEYYAHLRIPDERQHKARVFKAKFELSKYFSETYGKLWFHVDYETDFTIFTCFELTNTDRLQIKLITDLNVSEPLAFNLFDYVYVD